ncbi:MAG TPA: helix-turn-helix transcriptional regulator [Candidatus Limnocylindria bacterium]|nr:helix-turn-helix transcriptional regulator [Candidatus Limnocylindria bacterium]
MALGARTRAARKRRRWSLRTLGERVGLTPSRISQIERGHGAGASLEVWFALAQALGTFLKVELGRDPIQEPDDAGHLAIQELALRAGREIGRLRMFEVPTRPAEPSLSVDVCLRDDRKRLLIIQECWNTFGNINAAVRSTRRKVAEAEQLAMANEGERAYRVAAVWVVRDTRRNREILTRYPEVFAAAFPGSSREWLKALTSRDAEPPKEMGLVWCDLRATRLFAWRRP